MATHSLNLEASSSQYASIADASQTGLDITGDFSAEAWVMLESLPSSAGTDYGIVHKANRVSTTVGYWWYIDSANNITFTFFDSSGNRTDLVGQSVDSNDIGVFVHLAVSVDVSNPSGTFYKNGVPATASLGSSSAVTIGGTAVPFIIGATYNLSNATRFYFDGLIKDVRIFSDIRTQAEIIADAHTENVSDVNLVAEWNFNNDYLDTTTNNNDLSGVNSPTFSTTLPDYNLYRIYPSMDGHIRNSGATYATVQSAATGNSVQDTDPDALTQNTVDAGTYYITRSVFIFDTSILPDTATISSATLNIKDTNSSFSNTDTDTLTVVSASPASDSSLSTADFDAFGTTSYGSLALSSRVANAYNTITLNADGLAAIAKTGNTRLGLRMAKDISATQPTGINRMAFYSVNRTGIGEDPYLEIVVSDADSALPSFFLNFV